MAYGIAEKLVAPTSSGKVKEMIEETWFDLCESLQVDPDTPFGSLDELFEVSPIVTLVDEEPIHVGHSLENDAIPHASEHVEDDEEKIFHAALTAGEQGRHEEVIKLLRPFMESGNYRAMETCGYAYARMGREEEATEILSEAAAGGWFDALTHLVSDAAEEEDEKSFAHWLMILVEHGDPHGQLLYGVWRAENLEYEDALAAWSAIIEENNPHYPDAVESARQKISELKDDPLYARHVLASRAKRRAH
jgi:tetratricopeptide (TPR) repeat protein